MHLYHLPRILLKYAVGCAFTSVNTDIKIYIAISQKQTAMLRLHLNYHAQTSYAEYAYGY